MNLSAIINSVQNALKVSPLSASPTAEAKKNFQEALVDEFLRNIESIQTCSVEYALSGVMDNVLDGYNDKCDVFVETKDHLVIVELDATRADQVAKKMLSRFFYAKKSNKPTAYLCLLYPGTEKMNPNECVKYMNMGKDILLSMNYSNRFLGAFVNGENLDWKLIE